MKLNIYSIFLAATELALLATTSQAYISGGEDLYDISSRDLGFDSPGDHYTRELYVPDVSLISTRDLVEELESRLLRREGPGTSTPGTGGGTTGTSNTGTGQTGNHKGQGRTPPTVEKLNEGLRKLKSGRKGSTPEGHKQEAALRAKIKGMGGVPYDEQPGAGSPGGPGVALNQPGGGGAPLSPPSPGKV